MMGVVNFAGLLATNPNYEAQFTISIGGSDLPAAGRGKVDAGYEELVIVRPTGTARSVG
jgi:hypothetical protein